MSYTGGYDTRYDTLTQGQLNDLFSTAQWNGLSFAERLDACQEVANRYAAEHDVEPCLITHHPMEGSAYGEQFGNTIRLNTYLVRDGQFCTHYTDQNGNRCEARINAQAPSWNTLDTVYHEGTHGIQTQLGQIPGTYITPNMDWDLYRIQGIEKEAYAAGQSRTLQALAEYEQRTGTFDPARLDYFASARNDSFQAALSDAARHYNDPNIEQTLATVIQDRENNVVRSNTSASYQAIYDLCDNYGIHSATALSNSPEAVSALAAGTNPETHAAAPPELAAATQEPQDGQETTETPEEAEETTAFLDDGLTTETGETGAADLSVADGMESDSTVELSGGEATYDDGGGELDAAPSTGEATGILQEGGLDDGKGDGKGTGTGIGIGLGGAALGDDGASQGNDDDYTP